MASPVIKTTRIGILDALFRQEVEYYWAREPSSIRVRGLGSRPMERGHARAPPLSDCHWRQLMIT